MFEPKDPEFATKVAASFKRQNIMRTVRATLDRVLPGEVVVTFPYQEELTQQHGFIHAGIVSTVLDSACGYAAFSLMPKDAAVLTVEFKINLLSPAIGDWFRAVGKVKKAGKNIMVTEGELSAYVDSSFKPVAVMMGTIMAVYDRPGIRE